MRGLAIGDTGAAGLQVVETLWEFGTLDGKGSRDGRTTVCRARFALGGIPRRDALRSAA